ncbi:hypothetical protein M3O37_18835, partial [Xanthomonas nasturtii]|nr:hypothetical protein [Xanthomonas nasturtii]
MIEKLKTQQGAMRIAPCCFDVDATALIFGAIRQYGRSIAERLIWSLGAGPLPAHHRRTRRESVHGGSGAASM